MKKIIVLLVAVLTLGFSTAHAAHNIVYAAALSNAQLDLITSQVGGSCLIEIYDGTQPAGPATGITTQHKLVTLTGNSTFAPAASGKVLTLNSITSGTGIYTGTAAWFRVKTSGGTALVDGTVGTSGADMNLVNTSIAVDQVVGITAFTVTNPN